MYNNIIITQELYEYVQTSSSQIFQSPFLIEASKSGHDDNYTNVDLTESKSILIQLINNTLDVDGHSPIDLIMSATIAGQCKIRNLIVFIASFCKHVDSGLIHLELDVFIREDKHALLLLCPEWCSFFNCKIVGRNMFRLYRKTCLQCRSPGVRT